MNPNRIGSIFASAEMEPTQSNESNDRKNKMDYGTSQVIYGLFESIESFFHFK